VGINPTPTDRTLLAMQISLAAYLSAYRVYPGPPGFSFDQFAQFKLKNNMRSIRELSRRRLDN